MSQYNKSIICLANSRKNSGRCIAGKEVSTHGFGNWIRPVSARADKELNAFDRRYNSQSNNEPKLLDIIDISFLRPDTHHYQTENHLIDEKKYWSLRGVADFNDIIGAVDPIQSDLWGLAANSSYHGKLDRILTNDAGSFGYSLRLIRVSDFKVRVLEEQLSYGNDKRHVRGYFTYSGHFYALSITDPKFSDIYLALPNATHDVGDAILCLSLGEPSPHQPNFCYKLIAGVIRS